jgi:hypothetical protein
MGYLDVLQGFSDNIADALDVQFQSTTIDSLRNSAGKIESHPFVSGYWQLILKTPPYMHMQKGNKVVNADQKKALHTISKKDLVAERWFNSTAESFTPPTRTLTSAVFPGFGGVNKSFITGQNIGNNFSVSFREYSKLPIIKLFNSWTSIVHNQTGLSPASEMNWNESLYKSECIAFITDSTQVQYNKQKAFYKFNRDSIQELYYFYGVYPETNPQDIQADIAANNTTPITINFKFDGWPLTLQDLDNDQLDTMYRSLEAIFSIKKK